MTVLRNALRAAALVVLTGCTSVTLRGADPGSLRSATLVEACPVGVPGTRLLAYETTESVILFFATRTANVEQLRLRVRDQARVNGPGRKQGRGHFGDHKGARNHGLRLWTMPPVRTTVEDTASGAKLEIVAVDPAHRTQVRDAVVARVAEIESADCF